MQRTRTEKARAMIYDRFSGADMFYPELYGKCRRITAGSPCLYLPNVSLFFISLNSSFVSRRPRQLFFICELYTATRVVLPLRSIQTGAPSPPYGSSSSFKLLKYTDNGIISWEYPFINAGNQRFPIPHHQEKIHPGFPSRSEACIFKNEWITDKEAAFPAYQAGSIIQSF